MTIRNLIITNCIFGSEDNISALISIDTCSDNKENVFRITAQKISFSKNKAFGVSVGFHVQDPDCYELFLEDVLFSSNTGNVRSTMAKMNSLVRIRLENNIHWVNQVGKTNPSFILPVGSNTTIQEMTATFVDHLQLYLREATLSMTDSLIEGAYAYYGPFIEAYDSIVNISGTEVRSSYVNSKRGGEGVFSFEKSIVNIASSRFFNNTGQNGGAILLSGGRLNLENVTFDANEANSGGAICVHLKETIVKDDEPVLSFIDTTFTNNEARDFGGGVFMNIEINKATIKIMESTFLSNNAKRGGIDTLLNVQEIRS